MKNVIIIYGGASCEHDISIITACLARGYFANHSVYGVYLDKNNVAYLAPNDCTAAAHVGGKFKCRVAFLTGERAIAVLRGKRIVKRIYADVIVNCCHGKRGEDGTVAAVCGLMNVPLVGSDITSSAVAMDKILTKQTLNSLDISTVGGFEINKSNVERLADLAEGYGYPLIVKPNTLGSSIGVAVCRDFNELKANVNTALTYDDRVLCERALTDFCELNCSAMRNRGAVETSKVDVPTTVNDILTFADKYISGRGEAERRTDVTEEIISQVERLTKQIYTQLNFNGVIRVDYLYDNVGRRLYVNEINSIPGSLAYGLWNGKYTMTQYGDILLNQAIADFDEQSKLTTTFSSSVLKSGSGVKRRKR